MTVDLKKHAVTYLSLTLLWLFVSFFLAVIYYNPHAPFGPQLAIAFLATALTILPSWYCATRLVPEYLYKKKINGFIGRVLLLTIASVVLVYFIAAGIYHVFTGKPVIREPMVLFMIVLLLLFVSIIFTSVGCGVKIIADRYNMEQRLLETEKEKISAELNFLRSQINPHFLFNILNTIYFQIDKTNERARESVEKFSEMLRYQLYDCNTDRIDINKEMEYIKSYVAMQGMRMEPGTDIQLQTGNEMAGFAIAPFIFLTLVENAFKHISHFKNPADNKIHIDIRNNKNILVVKVINTFEREERPAQLLNSGGMGIQNLKRRLELLYTDKAQLSVYASETVFESVLNLQLHD